MEYGPPPLFNQGVSARARLAFFAFLAIALIIVDDRLRTLDTLRAGVGVVLYPVQRALLLPRDGFNAVADYFRGSAELLQENEALRHKLLAQSQRALQADALLAENSRLRALLGARDKLAAPAVLGRVLYESRDRFTRKLVIDQGVNAGVRPGQPVLDADGVLGQVTRVFPSTAEVTLLIDKDQSIPVQLVRNGLRGVVFGDGDGLELRFMAATADIHEGDEAVTSGIDGLYPQGYPVGTVARIMRIERDNFARVGLKPAAGVRQYAHVLVLAVDPGVQPPRPPPDAAADVRKGARK